MWLLMCSVFALLSSTKVSATTSFAVSTRIPDEPCHEGETECGNRCCPYSDGVCCNDTQTCCRQGSVCLGWIPYCLGLKQDEMTPALYSERSSALREADCPSDMTTCPLGCCPLPNAVCCDDGFTCCPERTVCDNGMCVTDGTAAGRFLKAILRKSFNIPSTNTYYNAIPQRRPFNPRAALREADCPSDMTMCSDGCCPLPNAVCCDGGMTCCPEGTVCDNGMCISDGTAAGRFLKATLSRSFSVPSTNTYYNIIPQRRPFNPRAGDNCCQSWFGYICCQFPFVCTTMGCM